MSSEPAVRIEGLSKTFKAFNSPMTRALSMVSGGLLGKASNHDALKNLNINISRGECVGILGPNGSGKSTLLRIISGTMAPTAGRAVISGTVAGILELGAGFLPELSGRENAILNATISGISEAEAIDRLPWIENFADIGSHIEQPIRTYSSGMFVRLAFAVAAAASPDILVVDEALAVGDVAFQQKCHAHMRQQMRDATRLFVSHDVSRLAALCERSVVLRKGEIVYDGPTEGAIVEYLKLSHEQSAKTAHTELQLSGPREVDIIQIEVLVNGQMKNDVFAGDEVTVNLVLDNHYVVPTRAVIGAIWNDETGQGVFSGNSENSGFEVVLAPALQTKSFSFRWPDVRRGKYSLTAGVGSVSTPGSPQRLQCWAHNCADLVTMSPKDIHGILSLDLKEGN